MTFFQKNINERIKERDLGKRYIGRKQPTFKKIESKGKEPKEIHAGKRYRKETMDLPFFKIENLGKYIENQGGKLSTSFRKLKKFYASY